MENATVSLVAGALKGAFRRGRTTGYRCCVALNSEACQKPENSGGLERSNDVLFSNDSKTMYGVDYGELHVDFTMPSPFYVTPKSGVIRAITYTGKWSGAMPGVMLPCKTKIGIYSLDSCTSPHQHPAQNKQPPIRKTPRIGRQL